MRQLQCALKSAMSSILCVFPRTQSVKKQKPSIEDFFILMLGKLLDIRTSSTEKQKVRQPIVSWTAVLLGGPEGIRTLDLSDANRTRSQLRYGPKCYQL